ncbi:hypothetical protein GpartN1_g5618.t1 [Galdieria partita]|uniref:Uncharacterized protein n=1 Tax=Galdieria partita TaxID=83374 RepID=A0A9C7Q274_9RHOD|nr:hypothetical protein GpartN1_g5618.t1 [Galdieria partita]
MSWKTILLVGLFLTYFTHLCISSQTFSPVDVSLPGTEAGVIERLEKSVFEFLNLTGLDESSVLKVGDLAVGSLQVLGLLLQVRETGANETIYPPGGLTCNTLQKAVCYFHFGADICSTLGSCGRLSGGICSNDYFIACGFCVCG